MIPLPRPTFEGVLDYVGLAIGVTLGFGVADRFMPILGDALSKKEN